MSTVLRDWFFQVTEPFIGSDFRERSWLSALIVGFLLGFEVSGAIFVLYIFWRLSQTWRRKDLLVGTALKCLSFGVAKVAAAGVSGTISPSPHENTDSMLSFLFGFLLMIFVGCMICSCAANYDLESREKMLACVSPALLWAISEGSCWPLVCILTSGLFVYASPSMPKRFALVYPVLIAPFLEETFIKTSIRKAILLAFFERCDDTDFNIGRVIVMTFLHLFWYQLGTVHPAYAIISHLMWNASVAFYFKKGEYGMLKSTPSPRSRVANMKQQYQQMQQRLMQLTLEFDERSQGKNLAQLSTEDLELNNAISSLEDETTFLALQIQQAEADDIYHEQDQLREHDKLRQHISKKSGLLQSYKDLRVVFQDAGAGDFIELALRILRFYYGNRQTRLIDVLQIANQYSEVGHGIVFSLLEGETDWRPQYGGSVDSRDDFDRLLDTIQTFRESSMYSKVCKMFTLTLLTPMFKEVKDVTKAWNMLDDETTKMVEKESPLTVAMCVIKLLKGFFDSVVGKRSRTISSIDDLTMFTLKMISLKGKVEKRDGDPEKVTSEGVPFTDLSIRSELLSAYRYADRITCEGKLRNVHRFVEIKRFYEEADAFCNHLNGPNNRLLPYVVYLTGAPGTGKSTLIPKLCRTIGEQFGMDIGPDAICSMNTNDEFQDAWKPGRHVACILEEVNNIFTTEPKDLINIEAHKVLFNILNMASTNPYNLVRSQISEKSGIKFNALIVVVVSNNPNFGCEVLYSPSAFRRRANLCLEMFPTQSPDGSYGRDAPYTQDVKNIRVLESRGTGRENKWYTHDIHGGDSSSLFSIRDVLPYVSLTAKYHMVNMQKDRVIRTMEDQDEVCKLHFVRHCPNCINLEADPKVKEYLSRRLAEQAPLNLQSIDARGINNSTEQIFSRVAERVTTFRSTSGGGPVCGEDAIAECIRPVTSSEIQSGEDAISFATFGKKTPGFVARIKFFFQYWFAKIYGIFTKESPVAITYTVCSNAVINWVICAVASVLCAIFAGVLGVVSAGLSQTAWQAQAFVVKKASEASWEATLSCVDNISPRFGSWENHVQRLEKRVLARLDPRIRRLATCVVVASASVATYELARRTFGSVESSFKSQSLTSKREEEDDRACEAPKLVSLASIGRGVRSEMAQARKSVWALSEAKTGTDTDIQKASLDAKIWSNYCILSYEEPDGVRWQHGLKVEGTYVVTAHHFLQAYFRARKNGPIKIDFWKASFDKEKGVLGKPQLSLCLDESTHVRRIKTTSGYSDLCVILATGIAPAKNLIRFMWEQEPVIRGSIILGKTLHYGNCYDPYKRVKDWHVTMRDNSCSMTPYQCNYLCEDKMVSVNGFSAKAMNGGDSAYSGRCGSVLIAFREKGLAAIAGLNVAGEHEGNLNFYQYLVGSRVREAIDDFGLNFRPLSSILLSEAIASNPANKGTNLVDVRAERSFFGYEALEKMGLLTYHGHLEGQGAHMKSQVKDIGEYQQGKLVKKLADFIHFDELGIFPTVTEENELVAPVLKDRSTVDGEFRSSYKSAINQFASAQNQADTGLLELIVNKMVADFKVSFPVREGHFLDVATAMGGSAKLSHIGKMKLKTGAGFPFKGKKENYAVPFPREDAPEGVTASPELVRSIENIIGHYLSKECSHPVWMGHLKDEPIKRKKSVDNVRIFSCGPVDFFVLHKMVFGMFMELRLNNPDFFETVSGLNFLGSDFLEHFVHPMLPLQEERGIPQWLLTDFEKYDKTMNGVIGHYVARYLSECLMWYYNISQGSDEYWILMGVLSDCLAPVFVIGGSTFETTCGNPSGSLLTELWNSVHQQFSVRYVYLATFLKVHDRFDLFESCILGDREVALQMAKAKLGHYHTEIVMRVLGDDNATKVGKGARDHYNFPLVQSAYQGLGMKITSSRKDGSVYLFEGFDEVNIAKRYIGWDEKYQIWTPRLHPNSIRKMLTHIVSGPGCDDATRMALAVNGAIAELAFYGKEVLEQCFASIKEAALKIRIDDATSLFTLMSITGPPLSYDQVMKRYIDGNFVIRTEFDNTANLGSLRIDDPISDGDSRGGILDIGRCQDQNQEELGLTPQSGI